MLLRSAFAGVINGFLGEELIEVPGPTDYQVLKEVVLFY